MVDDFSMFEPTQDEIESAKINLARSAKIMQKLQQEEAAKLGQQIWTDAYKQAASEFGLDEQEFRQLVDDPQVIEGEGTALQDHFKTRVKEFLVEKAKIRASRRPHKAFANKDQQGRFLPKAQRQAAPAAPQGLDEFREIAKKRSLSDDEILRAMETVGIKDFMRGR